MMRSSLLALSLLLSSAAFAADKTPAGDVPPKDSKAEAPKDQDTIKASVQEDAQPVKRAIPLRGHTLAYTVTPGHLTIRNDDGEPTASIFYVAYTAPSAGRPRPVTFLFNGGPGSSSMWLHLGSFGPMKIDASLPEMQRPAPFRMTSNPDTLLDVSDLVFIDAPTTGLSRALGKSETKDLVGVDHDLDAFTRAIQRYLTVYGRWNSPKFIIGESYGTLRAAGLSNMLADKGVQLNGITLVSTVLDIGLLFGTYDQAYVNILPTYAAAAWYHNKVAGKPPLDSFLTDARNFARGRYAAALQLGNNLSPDERAAVAAEAARFTGLTRAYVLANNLRVDPSRFRKELLRSEGRIIGRLDARFTGSNPDQAGEAADYDPMDVSVSGAFIGLINDYLFRDLGYKTPLNYRPNNYGVFPLWDWKHQSAAGQQMTADTSADLAAAMRQNPNLKLLAVNGLFDLATPFAGAEYDIGHMALGPIERQNIRYTYYPAGHMMYIDPNSARQLKADLASFYASAM
ncbi:MAG: peptidase S10 [Pseudomonadota bacterium]